MCKLDQAGLFQMDGGAEIWHLTIIPHTWPQFEGTETPHYI